MTKDMNVEYIIVQAGGRGSRMEHMTDNKPKALVPVDNLPMIFHLFKKYPDKKFLIIGDYHYEIFSHYLSAIKWRICGRTFRRIRCCWHVCI